MDNLRKNHEKISARINIEQKNKIKRAADLGGKTLSDYIRDAVLSTTLDSAKMDFYLNINQNLINIKRSQLIITQLLLMMASEQLPVDRDHIMIFYKELVNDAEIKEW